MMARITLTSWYAGRIKFKCRKALTLLPEILADSEIKLAEADIMAWHNQNTLLFTLFRVEQKVAQGVFK